jgi:hypothetical protein
MLAHHTPLSRRTLVRHIGLVGLGIALAPAGAATKAPRAGASTLAQHPVLGHWLAVTPLGPAHIRFDPDGTVLIAWPHSGDGPNGYYEYTTSATGSWQPFGDHGLDLDVVAIDEDATGRATGTTSLASRLVVSADGGTFRSDIATNRLTTTSVDQATLSMSADGLPMSGIRMWPEVVVND